MGMDFFGGQPFMGGFFRAPMNTKYPFVKGPPPYGIWPATFVMEPGEDPPDPYARMMGKPRSNKEASMVGYQQQYRPAYASLAQPAAPAVPPPAPTGLTPGQRTGVLVLGTAETLFGAAAAWVGIRAGIKEKGVFKFLGWGVAAGGAVFALINLLGTVGISQK